MNCPEARDIVVALTLSAFDDWFIYGVFYKLNLVYIT